MIRLHSGGYMNTGQRKVMIRTIQDVMWDLFVQDLVTSYISVHYSCHLQGELCGRRIGPSTQNGRKFGCGACCCPVDRIMWL
jgi:hypothetical protein